MRAPTPDSSWALLQVPHEPREVGDIRQQRQTVVVGHEEQRRGQPGIARTPAPNRPGSARESRQRWSVVAMWSEVPQRA